MSYLSALQNPTVNSRNVGYSMPYPGGGFSSGVSNSLSGIGSNLPGIGTNLGTSYLNTTNGSSSFWNDGIQSEVSVNQQFYVDKETWGPESAGAKQCIWTRRVPGTVGGSNHARSYTHKSWSNLNYLNKYDPAYLAAYGNEPDCKKFLRDWDFLGIQAGQEPAYAELNNQVVQNYHVGRRARMICPHVMLRNNCYGRETVQELDVLYAVMRRYPLRDELEEQFGYKRKLDCTFDRYRHDQQKMLRVGALNAPVAVPVAAPLPAAKTEPQYYWRIDPYVSDDNCAPPLAAYSYSGDDLDFLSEDKSGWTGCWWKLGCVQFVEGSMAWSCETAAVARQFLYPTCASEAYKHAGNKLPDCIIQVRM